MKNYNPFKMWGSYVGASIFAFFRLVPITPIYEQGFFTTQNYILLTVNLVWAVIGFLIGWGIHSLFRRFSR